MPMIIRKAGKIDVPGLWALDRRLFPDGKVLRTKSLWGRDVKRHQVLMALVQGQIVGAIILDVCKDDVLLLRDLMVDPSFQNNPRYRVGGKLLESALALADAMGAKRQILTVEESNRSAVHLYEKFGFVARVMPKNIRLLTQTFGSSVLVMERQPFTLMPLDARPYRP